MMIAGLYAGLSALLYVYLSARIVRLRYKYKTPFGEGTEVELARAVRVHGNFIEYVPLALVLILMLDYMQFPTLLVHFLGVTLLAGRIAHAVGISRERGINALRGIGMVLTFLVLIVGGVTLVGRFTGLW